MSAWIDSEGVVGDGKVVCEVKQVYIHIPAELSATKFELKIAGVVRIIKKLEETILSWDPEELTYQDVASLYSSETDDWTLVGEDDVVSEQPHPLSTTKPGGMYPTLLLDEVTPIVKTKTRTKDDTTGKHSKEKQGKNTKNAAAKPSSSPSSHPSPESPVMFHLSDLKYVKESPSQRSSTIQSLTFYLSDGKELPTVYFYDGGTSGLIQALKRYLYFVRDGKDNRYLRVEESPFIVKANSGHMTTSHMINRDPQLDVFKGVEGFLSSAVLGVGKKVRQSFRNSRDMLEERPRASHDQSHDEEEISTITCHDIKAKGDGKGITPDPDMSLITDFQVVSDLSSQLPSRPFRLPRLPPIGREEWESYRQIDGRITREKEAEFRARVFAGGIEPSLRREVWKYLLGYFSFDATDLERMERQKMRGDQYEVMKKQWESFLPEQETHWQKWREIKNLVEKDVIRTDRELEMYHSITSPRLKQLQNILNTYVMYNFDLGYVQGMSDFLAPLLAVMDNEVDAFWCFTGLMKLVGHYFEETQLQMRMRIKRLRALLHVLDPKFYQFLKDKDSGTLYFSFRWLLIDFKREFIYDNIMCIWEVLWTNHLSSDYALFIALAILDQEKEKMMDNCCDFSDIIAHINKLTKKLDYESLLLEAESICRQIAAVPDLPEELDCLINRPLPQPHDFRRT